MTEQADPSSDTSDRASQRTSHRAVGIAKWIALALLFVLLHGWALYMLWLYGPAQRQLILVGVYAGILLGSAFLTRRFPPPVIPSLLLFAVVLIWRLMAIGVFS